MRIIRDERSYKIIIIFKYQLGIKTKIDSCVYTKYRRSGLVLFSMIVNQ